MHCFIKSSKHEMCCTWNILPFDTHSVFAASLENADVPGAPQQPGGHRHHGGVGHLLRREGETRQSAGELQGCTVHLQRQPGETFKSVKVPRLTHAGKHKSGFV